MSHVWERDGGDPARSLRRVRRWERIAPWSAELKLKRALLTWVVAGSHDDVELPKRLLRRAAQLASNNPAVLTRCASSMVEVGGVDEIEPWVNRARELAQPGFPLADDIQRLMGCVHWANGNHRAAEPLLRAAFYGDPTSLDGFPLAATYMEMGDYARAEATLEESLRRGARHPGLRQIQTDLDALPPEVRSRPTRDPR
jgi:hypothetical protein